MLFRSLQHTTASRLTIFLYTSPFWVALLLPLWVKSERMRWQQWLGLLLAFSAVVFALRDGLLQPLTPDQWLGDALALGAGAFWGWTTVAIRSTRLIRVSPEKLLFYQVANAAVLLPVLAWAMGEDLRLDYSAWAWGSIVVQAAGGAFASYLIWMWMLTRYPATLLSAFVFLTPVFAALLGVGLFGETLGFAHGLALVGVTLGIVLVNWPKPTRA